MEADNTEEADDKFFFLIERVSLFSWSDILQGKVVAN